MDVDVLGREIKKIALQNAVRYGTSPKLDVVLKRMLAEHPELRSEAKEVAALVKGEIERIESLSSEECASELAAFAPGLLAELEAKGLEPKRAPAGLPELPLARGEPVVMRFAPNPNGAATLGSARGIIINSEYAKRYGGKFILRFDDTDPVLKRPLMDAYIWYLEDCAWLDAEPDELVIASERIDLYYRYAEELIERGAAYVCFCPAETFKEYKDHKLPCPCRTASVGTTRGYWQKMLSGGYEEKGAVLRIKTDMTHPDPALRDWVAFRVLKRDHPRVGERYMVWPMLDFESAIEDHVLGITHIIRGKDLMKSEQRQRYLYEYFGWTYPRTMLWGKIRMQEFGKFSTSELRKAIERGEYEGWDDPRLPTLRALWRRGFQPEAIRKFFVSIGVTQTDIAVSMKNLYAENRKMIDPKAPRYFFVRNPVAGELKGFDYRIAKALKHPEGTEYREIPTGNTVYLADTDVAKLTPGQHLRLKYLCTIEVESVKPLRAAVVAEAAQPAPAGMPVIQWAPTNGITVKVKRPDGTDEGLGELLIADEHDRVVQFERYGFVRVDAVAETEKGIEVVAYFTH
ncbi:MAG TPA: glutamate--tRNA ligase [Methanomicrobia archaeon]|nr:glutamate--tRNA ligase [Methanomicrobia archaeon]